MNCKIFQWRDMTCALLFFGMEHFFKECVLPCYLHKSTQQPFTFSTSFPDKTKRIVICGWHSEIIIRGLSQKRTSCQWLEYSPTFSLRIRRNAFMIIYDIELLILKGKSSPLMESLLKGSRKEKIKQSTYLGFFSSACHISLLLSSLQDNRDLKHP